MHTPLRPLVEMARLNHRLFLNCLRGLDDAPARKRPSDGVNSIAFIALHVVDARYFLVRQMGGRAESPFAALLKDVNRVADLRACPSVEAIRQAWCAVEGRLERRFAAMPRERLARRSTVRFPVGDPTVLGSIAFLLQHESYHVGQLGMLRKYLGLGPMGYA